MTARARGFTLIELLIVVAIIGLIAAIATPNLMGAIDRTRQTTTIADMKQLGKALEVYMVDNNSYPHAPNGTVAEVVKPYIEPRYMPKSPVNDGWGTPLQWQSDGQGEVYSLVSYGKGGQAGQQNGGETTAYQDDLVLCNNALKQGPKGQ